MTKDAIDQIFDRARHGDVFAQVLMGQILIEGKDVQKDVQNGIGWMKNAAQCNCLYAKEYLDDDIILMHGDLVFEDDSLKSLGTVLDVTQRPYKATTEDKENKRVLMEEIPGKVAVDIKIEADADKVNGNLSVDSINILIGKTIDLNAGNGFVKGVIVDVLDMSEEKEALQ